MQLIYLFTVEYGDGTRFDQTPEDVSTQDPHRSAFYDVRQDAVQRFSLVGNGHTWTVDLTDGHFEIDGLPFVTEGDQPLPASAPLRLIFYRQHRHHFRAGTTQELSHQVTYFLGWQTTRGGKNYQQVVGLS
jgi:hypothetical protein